MDSAAKARTLVTGFGPFLKVTENPSGQLAEMSGCPLQVLEVSFEAVDAFLASVDRSSFDRLLMIGVATGRKLVTPELFARNQIGEVLDVRGVNRFGPIEEGAPLLLEGTLWTSAGLASLFPNDEIEESLDAGSYLCNYSYYCALRELQDKKVGFLHIPEVTEIPLDRQLELFGMLLQTL